VTILTSIYQSIFAAAVFAYGGLVISES